MRFLISLALVASVLVLETSSHAADSNTNNLHTLEGELRVHPKYLYKYYLVFGDGQKCALYSSAHKHEDESLAALKPGARVRVRGVLGTEFHRSTGTKDNPSPFGSAWIMYMDIDTAEVLDNSTTKRRKPAAVKVGMTFQEVIKAQGRHYRPYIGARVGSIRLMYDDISVDIFDYAPGSNTRKGRVRYIQKTDLDTAAELLNDIPYADEKLPNN